MSFEEGEQFFTVVYFGPNASSGSVDSSLKFVGTKKEGGFVVIDADKVYFEMEWRDSANLTFLDECTTIFATGSEQAKL